MRRQLLLAIFANIGTFFFGTSAAWSSPSMSFIVENKNYSFWVTRSQFGFVVAAMSFGSMCASLPTGLIRHRYGTKRTILLFVLPAIFGSILITVPQNLYMLIFGRFLIGLPVGCYIFLVQIYVGEVSSIKNRASYLNFIHIFVHLGIIFVYTLGHFVSHRTLNIICGSIPIFYAIAFQLTIESPPYLRSKGKHEKADLALKWLGEQNKSTEVELLKPQNNHQKSLKELLSIKSTRKAMIVMCMQFFFFQMSGVNAINFYAQSIFMETGLKALHPGVSSIIYVSILMISSFSASIFAKKFDRRKMICIFNSINVVCLGIIGTYFCIKKSGHDVDGYGWIPLVALCVNAVAFTHGNASVTWGLLGELFTIEAKKMIAPVAQIVSNALTGIICLSFPTLTELIGVGNIFYIFAVATFVDIIFAYFFIPETRGKTIEEIQEALQK